MAGQLGFLANLLSGTDGAGAALQAAIAKQRYQNIAETLLTGGNLTDAYREELEHPLSEGQIFVLDLLRGAPYAIAAYQGAAGSSWSGDIGRFAGRSIGNFVNAPEIGALLGGTLAGIAQVHAQNVLAEYLGRERELYASMATLTLTGSDWSRVAQDIQNGYQALSLDFAGAQRLAKMGMTLFNAVQPALQTKDLRRRATRIHHTGVEFSAGNLRGAIHESASRTLPHFLQGPDTVGKTILELPVFIYNLAHSLKQFQIADGGTIYSLFERIPGAHAVGNTVGHLGSSEGLLGAVETNFNSLPTSWQDRIRVLNEQIFKKACELAQTSTQSAYEFLQQQLSAVMQQEVTGHAQTFSAQVSSRMEQA